MAENSKQREKSRQAEKSRQEEKSRPEERSQSRQAEKMKSRQAEKSRLGKCHFLPGGGGAPENWGDQVLCLRSKGGSKDFSN